MPVRPAGHVEQHHGARLRLPRLEQRQQLERLVERAEATGEEHERVGLLDELELPGEEVPEVHELRVAVGEQARRRLERELDRDPERLLGARTLEPGFHDAGARAGDDHPIVRSHLRRERSRLLVERIAGLCARGADDRELPRCPVGRERVERVAHLLERGVGQLQVATVRTVSREAHGGCDNLEHLVGVRRVGYALHDLRDLGVERGVAGSVARELHRISRRAGTSPGRARTARAGHPGG